jgi:hypothetical protein
MGLMSWLFPSPEQRLARARTDLARGRYADARLTALEFDSADAAEIVREAELHLCRANLKEAESWLVAGDDPKVDQHLALAKEFLQPECSQDLAELRRRVAETRVQRERDALLSGRDEVERLLDVNPNFRTGRRSFDVALPEGVSEEEAEMMQTRLTLVYENYPEELRRGMLSLGAAFSAAVIAMEDGELEAAAAALAGLPDDEPLVCYERARLAFHARRPSDAVAPLTAFVAKVGGHRAVGANHTAIMLTVAQLESGDITGAMETIVGARRSEPDLGSGLYASLLERQDRLSEAEQVLRGVLKRSGTQPWVYTSIARVRVKAGKRLEAMQALETGLRNCGCAPGSCGSKPPDLESHRMLATLYLEDQVDVERGLELADTARGLVRELQWEDLYLAALSARVRQDPGLPAMVEELRRVTAPHDPRWARVEGLA